MTKLDVIKRCEFFYDGQLTIDRTKELIDDAISFTTLDFEDVKKLKPVSLILLDFQMPVKNGIDVVNELRRYYRVINETLEDTKPGFELIEPQYVFITSFSTPQFRRHLQSLNIKLCYDKPIQLSQLETLINSCPDDLKLD